MSAVASTDELQRFRQVVADRTGLSFPEDHVHRLSDVLTRRTQALGSSCEAYLQLLETPVEGPLEWERLADELTVGETFFFRHAAQFQALSEQAIPDTLRRGGRRSLHLLSAGCSTGEEAYSLAMTVQDLGEQVLGVPWSVTAIDLNPQSLERARLGVYTSWSLRETSLVQRERHFLNAGPKVLVMPETRPHVSFEQRNLIQEDTGFWCPGRFDIIFCRNVLMYLVPSIALEVIKRLSRSLVPGGYLFLGHAETLRGLSSDFETISTHGTFYYRKHDGEGVKLRGASILTTGAADGITPPPPLVEGLRTSAGWIAAIGRSAERVATLADAAGRPAGAEPVLATAAAPSSALQPPPRYLGVIGLLQQERYGAAVSALAELEPLRHDPLHTVLAAIAQLHNNEEGPAEAALGRQLIDHPLDGRLHYLLGLCREQAGDAPGAMVEYRAASTSESTFALPHLRLGLLLRRDARPQEAKAELVQAWSLIAQEEDLHLALFGGGFSREAIADLCRRMVQGGRS